MGKLYAITSGEYSDYHIVTLCSDKDVAIKIVERLERENQRIPDRYSNLRGEYYIQEYEDGVTALNSDDLWDVVFDKRGNIIRTCNNGICFSAMPINVYDYTDHPYCRERDKVLEIRNIPAKHKKQAIKIACDRRASYLAQKEGI